MDINNLDEALCDASSVPEAIRSQVDILRNTKILRNLILANKLETFNDHFCNRDLINKQRDLFNNLYDEIDMHYPSILFRIEGRRKSFVSTYKKLISKPDDYSLQDISAFRIILFGNESIDACYQIAEMIILYGLNHGFNPCPATSNYNNICNVKDIEIPQKSRLKEEYQPYVEDYILHPKENGYQSLQITFLDTKGYYFEVQIRTIKMHSYAEYGPASHKKYKSDNYGKSLDFHREKINISGYQVITNDSGEIVEILDFVGLEESLEILRRQKTHA